MNVTLSLPSTRSASRPCWPTRSSSASAPQFGNSPLRPSRAACGLASPSAGASIGAGVHRPHASSSTTRPESGARSLFWGGLPDSETAVHAVRASTQRGQSQLPDQCRPPQSKDRAPASGRSSGRTLGTSRVSRRVHLAGQGLCRVVTSGPVRATGTRVASTGGCVSVTGTRGLRHVTWVIAQAGTRVASTGGCVSVTGTPHPSSRGSCPRDGASRHVDT